MAISAGTGRVALAAWLENVRQFPFPVSFALVREKELPAASLVEACRETKLRLGPETQVLVAGGRIDLALAAELAGVHLGSRQGELRVDQVRQLLPGAFVSISCHTLEEVRQARAERASAVLFAPVFGKVVNGTQVVPGLGLQELRRACEAAGPMPVLALGGVTPENAGACLGAGAAGIAGIRMFAGGSAGSRAEVASGPAE